MSEQIQFVEEKEKIDLLISQGYKITSVKENLSGAFVEFEKAGEKKELHILTADARKYFSIIILSKRKGA
jgi:hypothetical protein